MTGLVLCQKRISAVRWVTGKYWQFNFLKADFYPGALMEMVVVWHYFCVYVSREGLLCGGRGTWGWLVAAAVPLREQLAAAGGCSEAGFGGRQAGSSFCFSSSAPRFLVTVALVRQIIPGENPDIFFLCIYFFNFLANMTWQLWPDHNRLWC